MTENGLITYIKDRLLLAGRIKLSSFESTDGVANMVKLTVERIENKPLVMNYQRLLWKY